jgi:PAS domain S-box-containing protein
MDVTSLSNAELQNRLTYVVEKVRNYAVFMLDENGIIVSWNSAAAAIKGHTAEQAIGQHLRILYTEVDRVAGRPEHNLAAAESTGTYQEQAWRLKRDGTYFWALIELTAIRADDGALIGFCKVTRDLSELKQVQEALASQRERACSALDALHDGVISVERDGMVSYLNPIAEKLTGWASVEAEGNPVGAVFHCDPDHNAAGQDAKAAHIGDLGQEKADGLGRAVEILRTRDGESHVVEATTCPIRAGADTIGDLIVFRDIEARLAVEQQRRNADRRKDDFLATLAHELRNPLAPVTAAAALLAGGKLDRNGIYKASQVIMRQVHHMSELVDDILDVSRVTRGLVEIEELPQDLKAALSQAVEQIRPLIECKHHALKLALPREAAHVLGDHKRLVQVFANLLGNAARYTPKGGTIRVAMAVNAGFAIVHVMDNGIGIAPELQRRVFGLFEQAERSSDRVQGGLGIGLALVHDLIGRHGGTVTCTSDGVGHGSCFTVRLPLLEAGTGVPERRRSSRVLPDATVPLNILVVDDNEDAAEMLRTWLEASAHTATAANNGRDALALCAQSEYDVCIIDRCLPDLDGEQLAAMIREQMPFSPTLIQLSGLDLHNGNATTSDFDFVLVKPADLQQLHSILTNVAAQHRASANEQSSKRLVPKSVTRPIG